MSRRSRAVHHDCWRHLTPEVKAIVKENIRAIRRCMETAEETARRTKREIMTAKSEDIEGILAKARIAAPYEVWIGVRRAKVYGIGTIEFPSWLSELWLLDGHWAKGSARFMSKDQFVKELEDVLALVQEPTHETTMQDMPGS